MGQTAEVGLGQEFATAEVGVEVEGVIKGGQAENERGPHLWEITDPEMRFKEAQQRQSSILHHL